MAGHKTAVQGETLYGVIELYCDFVRSVVLGQGRVGDAGPRALPVEPEIDILRVIGGFDFHVLESGHARQGLGLEGFLG